MSLTEGVIGLDHVILVVPDLRRAMGELAFTVGLVVEPGGEHPGWGTHNAIVRFGVTYLELIAVSNRDGCRATFPRPAGGRP